MQWLSVRASYLDELRRRVLVFDGAMGTSVQALELSAADFGGPALEGCNDFLVISRPDVVAEIHRSFLRAGADVVETDTFGGSRLKLGEYGLADRVHEINSPPPDSRARPPTSSRPPSGRASSPGSMGPTGMLPSSDDPTLSDITFGELAEIFAEQAEGARRGRRATCC